MNRMKDYGPAGIRGISGVITVVVERFDSQLT
jgi:hypothetical protein